MLFYEGPRDIVRHMQEFERRMDLPGYDHRCHKTPGWRNEMMDAKAKQNEAVKSIEHRKLSTIARLIRSARTLFHPRVYSID